MVEILITFITAFVIGVLMKDAFDNDRPIPILLLIFIVGCLTGLGLYSAVQFLLPILISVPGS